MITSVTATANMERVYFRWCNYGVMSMISAGRRLALLLFVLIFLINCNPSSPRRGTTERLVSDYLASKYPQPKDDVWYDGVTYFFPEKPRTQAAVGSP
jgi:hypothetical protein